MKGATNYLGSDKFNVLLINDKHNSGKNADHLIDRYKMHGHTRVRMKNAACAKQLLSQFGHFSWGYIVIAADGTLVAINALAHELKPALERAVGVETKKKGAFSFFATISAGMPVMGNPLLKKDRKATLTVTVMIPKGWHVNGHEKGGAVPITFNVKYPEGFLVGKPVFSKGRPGPDGKLRHSGSIKITVPAVFPKGTPIGHHVLHGDIQFLASDEEAKQTQTTLKWFADSKIM
ncbi:MAG: hypothetical protein ACI97A_003604 [Planctomycetota bacterium]